MMNEIHHVAVPQSTSLIINASACENRKIRGVFVRPINSFGTHQAIPAPHSGTIRWDRHNNLAAT
jgi:hypothetical protein